MTTFLIFPSLTALLINFSDASINSLSKNFFQNNIQKDIIKNKEIISENILQSEDQQSGVVQNTIQVPSTVQTQDQVQDVQQKEIQKEIQQEIQLQQEIIIPTPKPINLEIIQPSVISPPGAIGVILPSTKKKKKAEQKKKNIATQQGYNVFAKERNKFIRANKKPLIKKDATNLTAFLVDNTISRTGFIKSTKKNPVKPSYPIPPNYYKKNIKKFRTFKQKKGKKIPIKRTLIEKRKYALDTPNEIRQITVLKELAKLKRQRKIADRKSVV